MNEHECKFEDVIYELRDGVKEISGDIKELKTTVKSFDEGLMGTRDSSKRGLYTRVDILEAFKANVLKICLGILSAGGVAAVSVIIYKIAGVQP